MMAIIGVQYDGQNPASYNGVRVHFYTDKEEWTCNVNTGDPKRDFDSALAFAAEQGADTIYTSSSVDDFAADGGAQLR